MKTEALKAQEWLEALKADVARTDSALRADVAKGWDESQHPRGSGGKFGAGHSENDPAYKKTNAAIDASRTASQSYGPEAHVAAAKAHATAAEAHYRRAVDAIDSGDKPKAFQSAGAALQHAEEAKFHADEIHHIAQDTGSVVPPSLKGQATRASTQADMSYDKIYDQLGVSG